MLPEPKTIKIPISSIVKTTFKDRTEVGDLRWMVRSLKEHNLLKPIVVNESSAEPGRYELISGSRRVMAALECDWEFITARMFSDLTEAEMKLLELEADILSKPLTPAEECYKLAELYELKREEYELDQTALSRLRYTQQIFAREVNRSQSSVSDTLAIARMLKEYPELEKAKTKREMQALFRRLKHEGPVKPELELIIFKAIEDLDIPADLVVWNFDHHPESLTHIESVCHNQLTLFLSTSDPTPPSHPLLESSEHKIYVSGTEFHSIHSVSLSPGITLTETSTFVGTLQPPLNLPFSRDASIYPQLFKGCVRKGKTALFINPQDTFGPSYLKEHGMKVIIASDERDTMEQLELIEPEGEDA